MPADTNNRHLRANADAFWQGKQFDKTIVKGKNALATQLEFYTLITAIYGYTNRVSNEIVPASSGTR